MFKNLSETARVMLVWFGTSAVVVLFVFLISRVFSPLWTLFIVVASIIVGLLLIEKPWKPYESDIPGE